MKWERPIKLILYGGFLGGYAILMVFIAYGTEPFPYGSRRWELYDSWRPLLFGGLLGMVRGAVDRSYKTLIIGGVLTGVSVTLFYSLYIELCRWGGEAIIFLYPIVILFLSVGLVLGDVSTSLLICPGRIPWWNSMKEIFMTAGISLLLYAILRFLSWRLLWCWRGASVFLAYHLLDFIFGACVGMAFCMVTAFRTKK